MTDAKTAPNTLRQYFCDMGKYNLLTPEEEKDCATQMVGAYSSLVAELLKLPLVWLKIHDMWARIKASGKATNKMAEEYGNQHYSSEELTLQVDAHIEAALYFMDNERAPKCSYLFKAAGLSREIYLDMVDDISVHPEVAEDTRVRILALRDKMRAYHHKLITSNLKLVIKFATNFNNYGVPFEDLIQEGNLGLMRAAEKFDPARGHRFSTYAAWWIRQSFVKALKRHGRQIRLPSHIHDAMIKLKKTHEALASDLDREPSLRELSVSTGMDVDMVERLMDLRSEPLSFDTPLPMTSYFVADNRPKCLRDFIKDSAPDPLEALDLTSRNYAIEKALDESLTPSEKRVIVLRFGLGGTPAHTREEVAAMSDLSRERIRQLEASALEKLKEHAPYLEEYNNE